MAEAIITKKARNKMLRARAGDDTLPKISQMAFGSGGVSGDGAVIPPDPDQSELKAELLKKNIDSHEYISETQCRYVCTLTAEELAGKSISEIALVDADGDLVAIKNFSAKGKDDDLEMTFNVDDIF